MRNQLRSLSVTDPEIYSAIEAEKKRQMMSSS